jgi:hypothetical protein
VYASIWRSACQDVKLQYYEMKPLFVRASVLYCSHISARKLRYLDKDVIYVGNDEALVSCTVT